MERKEIISYCLSLGNVYEDYPFDENWTVMRHCGNQKAFAFLYERSGTLQLNLKNDPLKNEWLCQHVSYISPGYHMNKTHWITIMFSGTSSLVLSDISDWIDESFALTMPKPKHRIKSDKLSKTK